MSLGYPFEIGAKLSEISRCLHHSLNKVGIGKQASTRLYVDEHMCMYTLPMNIGGCLLFEKTTRTF